MKHAFLNEFETKKALADFILKTDKLSMDRKCIEFEIEFSKMQGRKFGVLFNSGGSANLAILQALRNMGKIKNGSKIGFSALTWSTNVMPIIQLGFEPVPIDCEINTLNVSSRKLIERINKTHLHAFFLTNALGFVDDIENIRDICFEKKIILLEDNCESLGTEVTFGKTGNFGLCSSFSFFVAHHMSTIEGGMVCCDDSEFVEMLKIVRANGWDRNLSSEQQKKWRKRFNIKSEFLAKYSFYELGYNLRPTEITGFLGLYQLQFLDENIKKREENYKKIEQVIITNNDFIYLKHDHIKRLSTFAIPIVCKSPKLRNYYLSQFSGAGIEVRPMIAGNMQNQPFYKKYVNTIYNLDGADFIHGCGFYCGNYPDLSENDLETISSCLYQL